MTPLSRHDLSPVGEMLVSYEASQMPIDVLERLGREAAQDARAGDIPDAKALIVLHWLLRIACQKLRALETAP